MTQPQPLLELKNVHSYYGNIHALKGISLTVGKGEIVTLIGANGAGKSTTLRTISGIIQPRQGEVRLDGQRIDQLPPAGRFTGLRNILYAIEWWVFAAFAAFLWWRHVRDATAEPLDGEPAAADDPAGAVPSEP